MKKPKIKEFIQDWKSYGFPFTIAKTKTACDLADELDELATRTADYIRKHAFITDKESDTYKEAHDLIAQLIYVSNEIGFMSLNFHTNDPKHRLDKWIDRYVRDSQGRDKADCRLDGTR